MYQDQICFKVAAFFAKSSFFLNNFDTERKNYEKLCLEIIKERADCLVHFVCRQKLI